MIECIGLCKTFGENIIFDQLDYAVGDTGIHAICGSSGCGKTTLVRMIMGLEPVSGGRIEYSKTLSFSSVFAEDRLIPTLSVLDNVNYAAGDKQKAIQALQTIRLEDAAGTYISELSSGMKRRVALARALAYGGDLLVLDEPFKGLDKALAQHIAKVLARLADEVPIILISHDVNLMESISASMLFVDEQKKQKRNGFHGFDYISRD